MNQIKTLTSAEDFVLHHCMPQTQEEAESESILAENFYRTVPNYAQLLKRKPELWMFVQCDDKGMPMDENASNKTHGLEYVKQYHTAKQRCLFDGFEVVKTVGEFTELMHKEAGLFVFDSVSNVLSRQGIADTISDLIRYQLPLTESALKLIYK